MGFESEKSLSAVDVIAALGTLVEKYGDKPLFVAYEHIATTAIVNIEYDEESDCFVTKEPDSVWVD